MTVRKYRKRPVVIEAIQYTGQNLAEIMKWCPDLQLGRVSPYIKTLEGDMSVGTGDWIVKGVKNEFYPVKLDVFEVTYELAEG